MPRPAWTRRGFLAAVAASPWAGGTAAAQTRLPSERKEYRDRLTEFSFFRVNAQTSSAWLPAPTNRMFARRGRFLLHASDRGGSIQAWAMDLKSGELRQWTSAAKLDPASLALTLDEKQFCYVDGAAVYLAPVGGGRASKLADLPGHVAGAGISIASDGQTAALVSGGRILRLPLNRGTVAVLHVAQSLRAPMMHPKRPEIAYFVGAALWTARLDGSKPAAVPLPPGRVLDAHWPPNLGKDSSSLLYLQQPDDAGRTVNLREYDLIAKRDRLIGLTSQYSSFSPNADASVFAGASFSKAQPYLYVLVRSVARELTLCEHNATDATRVTPVFTPDSQQIFFQSNREGKPAIYSIGVEKLVEATEDEERDGRERKDKSEKD